MDTFTLAEKLNPTRFPNMSGKMGAIVGYLLGEEFTTPKIAEIIVTSDGYCLAQQEGDIGHNAFLGTYTDLVRNWQGLITTDGVDLTPAEIEHCLTLPRTRIRQA